MSGYMKEIDRIIARIPLTEITVRTSLDSYAVIERIENGLKPVFSKHYNGRYYTFDGGYDGNYFVIQSHLRDESGADVYPNDLSVGVMGIFTKIQTETSPKFYGRVFDDGQAGSTIRGHFGFPFPTFCLVVALGIFAYMISYPQSRDILAGFPLVLLVYSIFKMPEFIDERKGILDFLKGLFFDVIDKK